MNKRVSIFLLTILGAIVLLYLGLHTLALLLMSAGLTIHWIFKWRGAVLGILPYGGVLYNLTGDWVTVIITLVTILGTSAVISYFLITHRSFSYMLTGAASMILLSDVALLKIVAGRQGVSIPDLVINIPFEEMMPALYEMLESRGFGDSMKISAIADTMRQAMNAMFPAFLIIASLITAYVIIALTRSLLLRIGLHYDYLPYFYDLKCSRLHVYVTIFTLVLALLLAGTLTGNIFFNLFFITWFVIVVCGLSVVDFHLKVHKVPGALRCVLYIAAILILSPGGVLMILLNPFFVLGVLGCLDAFRNLRLERAGD